MLILRKPGEQDEAAVAEFVAEFYAAGEESLPGSTFMTKYSYADWLVFCRDCEREETVRPGLVPATAFLSVRQGDGRIIGCICIRHRLNEYLLNCGGHIGYAIRPSERRRGYGSEQLGLALLACPDVGVSRALVTCDLENLGSARVMLKNGGVEDKSYTEESGQVVRRFWFDV